MSIRLNGLGAAAARAGPAECGCCIGQSHIQLRKQSESSFSLLGAADSLAFHHFADPEV